MSVSPSLNAGRISSTPSVSCLAPSPFGISSVFLNGLRTNPIGCGVNINASVSAFIIDPGPARKTGSRNSACGQLLLLPVRCFLHLVGRGSIGAGDGLVEESQVDAQLRAMVDQVVHHPVAEDAIL